jgi:hypothetical protein
VQRANTRLRADNRITKEVFNSVQSILDRIKMDDALLPS